MLKFLANKDAPTGPLIGLGLSKRNIQLLKEGKPIVVNLADMGLPPGKILLFYGDTEAAMTRQMLPFISEDTIMHGAESLEKEP